MIERGVKAGLDIHNLDTDKIAHQILEDLDEPVYKQFREEIAQDFGIPFVNGVLDRRALSDTLFWYPSRMKEYNRRIRPLLLTRVRKEIAGLHGVVLLNSALLVEAGLMPVCNNQVIHIYNLDPDLQRERMRSRGLSEDQIDTRISVQTPRKERDSVINGIIAGSAFGSVHCVFDDLTTDKAFSIIAEEGRTL
jgi:dephospho-CoA kinase